MFNILLNTNFFYNTSINQDDSYSFIVKAEPDPLKIATFFATLFLILLIISITIIIFLLIKLKKIKANKEE